MSQSDRISIRPMCFGTYKKAVNSSPCLGCSYIVNCIAEEDRLEAQLHAYEAAQTEAQAKAGDTKPARSKYHREIKPGVWVDVYDVLQAFQVTNPALQHAVKKALAAGQRGHKDRATDMAEIVQSAIRAQELEQ